jgi:hypothetical protein
MILEQKDFLNATPQKGIYQSIIADYGLETSVSELVDNAIDVWIRRGKKTKLTIHVVLDLVQKTITVSDNAGGIPERELYAIISPGASLNTSDDQTIGIFGVGSKRAVVALAQDIEVRTHFKGEDTHLIRYNEEWLSSHDWQLPYFRASNIPTGTTIIELKKLRKELGENEVASIRRFLSQIYGKILKSRQIELFLGSEKIKPFSFENWAFPPNYPPQEYTAPISFSEGETVKFRGIAGLKREEGSIAGEYGVYFYCNNRLIGGAIMDYHVGFQKPHHGISLVRVVIHLDGPAKHMPWTSNKAGINYSSPTFIAIRRWVVESVEYFSRVSRALIKEWDPEMQNLKEGEILQYKASNVETPPAFYRPDPPRIRFSYKVKALTENKKVFAQAPHSKGLLETMIAVETIFKDKSLSQKNRICLVLLDSTLEIAFKDYLLNKPANPVGINQLKKLCPGRPELHQFIRNEKVIPNGFWPKIEKYYTIRCDLIHQKSDAIISNPDIEDFRNIVESILHKLFGLKWPK